MRALERPKQGEQGRGRGEVEGAGANCLYHPFLAVDVAGDLRQAFRGGGGFSRGRMPRTNRQRKTSKAIQSIDGVQATEAFD